MPIIPTTEETEVGGSQSETGPGKIKSPYLKNKLKFWAETWFKSRGSGRWEAGRM
jgi:hypothetical protein